MKPFLKWVGGKSRLVRELAEHLPLHSGTHHEPFAGSAAFFFAREQVPGCLSDVNRPLIDTYLAVRDHLEELSEALAYMQVHHSEALYYKTRASFNKGLPLVATAAAFIYLNKTCFNGVFRTNADGAFNVPMGAYKNPVIFDRDTLCACSNRLRQASLSHASFQIIASTAAPGDFVYFDPPYHETYTGYSAGGFGEREQIQLAEVCRTLDDKGVKWLLSNSDTPLIHELYAGRFWIVDLEVRRSVGQKVSSRKAAREVLVRNY